MAPACAAGRVSMHIGRIQRVACDTISRCALSRISRERATDLLGHLTALCPFSVRRLIAFSSTDFSLCAFSLIRRSKPHRLKPVLLKCAGPACGKMGRVLQQSSGEECGQVEPAP